MQQFAFIVKRDVDCQRDERRGLVRNKDKGDGDLAEILTSDFEQVEAADDLILDAEEVKDGKCNGVGHVLAEEKGRSDQSG